MLGSLKARRQEILNKEYLDLAVPRWTDPEIIVRYKPVDHAVIRRAQMNAENAPKKKRIETELNGNCDILIYGCVHISARIGDKTYSLNPDDPEGELTQFDSALAANLGLEQNATARSTVKALFLTDGDLLQHASRVVEWSGFREDESDEELEGE